MKTISSLALGAAFAAFSAVVLLQPVSAEAGLLDKLNNAVKSLPKIPSSGAEAKSTATQSAEEAARKAAPATAAKADQVSDTVNTAAAKLPSGVTKAAAPAASGGDIWHEMPRVPGFGTKAAVATLMKTIPPLSAGDFTLGMPADAALAKMKEVGLNPEPGNRQNFYFQIRQVPDVTYLGGARGTKDGEQLDLNFTMYPNEAVVTSIRRFIQMDQAAAPTLGTTLDALRKKYGTETFKEGHEMTAYWFFDYQGHPLTAQQYQQLNRLGCAVDGSTSFHAETYMADGQAGKVAEGIKLDDYDRHSFNTEPCYSAVVVRAQIIAVDAHTGTTAFADHDGWNTNSATAVVTSLGVTISDLPLDASAAIVSHNLAIGNDEAQRQREIEAAGKRKAPTL